MRFTFAFFSFPLALAIGCGGDAESQGGSSSGGADSGVAATDAGGRGGSGGNAGGGGVGGSSGSDAGVGGGSGAGGRTDAGSGNDAGTSDLIFCRAGAGCPTGFDCQMSLCSSTGIGFCARTPVDTCGGFRPLPPDTCMNSGDICLGQGGCVADAPGVCVSPAQRDAICAEQRNFWNCS